MTRSVKGDQSDIRGCLTNASGKGHGNSSARQNKDGISSKIWRLGLLLACVALSASPRASAKLIQAEAQIVVYCNETVRFRIIVDNDKNVNPLPNYTEHVGSGVEALRPWTTARKVDPDKKCIKENDVKNELGQINTQDCQGTKHESAPALGRVGWGVRKPIILASAPVSEECPATTVVTLPVDRFFEGPDLDEIATYNKPACTLQDPNEALLARELFQWTVSCIVKPPVPARGQASATGQFMHAYADSTFGPGTTRVSFDMTWVDFAPISGDTMTFFYGESDGPRLLAASAPVNILGVAQVHVVQPSADLLPYMDGDFLHYFVTNEAGEVLFVSCASIPTLTEWGLIIFGVVLLGFITWVFLRRRRAVVSYQ